MATIELNPPRERLQGVAPRERARAKPNVIVQALSVLASLKLTVALFAASIFLIFMGTLAQKDHDVWEVVNTLYFRTWFARIDFQAFERLVQIFFKNVDWGLKGYEASGIMAA